MTPRPALVFVGATFVALIGAIGLLVHATASYLADSRAVSSTSGDYVYRSNGALYGYHAFVVGPEPVFIAVALALVVFAITIAAVTWRRAP